MADSLTATERANFTEYLRNCTNNQVRGVLQKEQAAGRREFADLARIELARRGMEE